METAGEPAAGGGDTSPANEEKAVTVPGGEASPRGRFRWRQLLTSPLALLPLALVLLIGGVLVAATGLENLGLSFWGTRWNFIAPPVGPAGSSYGILTFVEGSLITTVLALVLATGLSLALAISLTVYLPFMPQNAAHWVSTRRHLNPVLRRILMVLTRALTVVPRVLTTLTDLLAGIPSVVYGIWGFVILGPYFAFTAEPTLRTYLGWLPWFGGPQSNIGPSGLLLATFVLTIMVVPLTTAIMRESLRSVPVNVVEAGMALGATKWEVVRHVRLKMARQGLWGAVFLGFGRAFGESVAVAMLIGADPQIPTSIYGGSHTMAAFIFLQLESAFLYPDLLRALAEVAIVLLVVAAVFNLIGQKLTGTDAAARTGDWPAGGAP